MSDYAEMKSRGKDHRRGKAKYGGGRGRGKGGGKGGGGGEAGGGGDAGKGAKGGNAGKGKKLARFGGRAALRGRGFSGQRRGRSVAHSGDNSYRFEEAADDQYEFEMRLEKGADIERLLSEQSGGGYSLAIKAATVTKQVAGGELNRHALAVAMASLPPAERLQLDPALFDPPTEGEQQPRTPPPPPAKALEPGPGPAAARVQRAAAPKPKAKPEADDDDVDSFLDSL